MTPKHRLSRLIPSGEPRDVRGQELKPLSILILSMLHSKRWPSTLDEARLCAKGLAAAKRDCFAKLSEVYSSLQSAHGWADAPLPRAAEAMLRSQPVRREGWACGIR